MTSSAAHDQEYQQAQKAYIQGNYEEAAKLVDRLVQKFPEDASSRLLKGHIYCVLQQYDVAQEQYQAVLNLTEDPEIIDCSHKGLETISQYESYDQSASNAAYNKNLVDDPTFSVSSEWSEHLAIRQSEAALEPELEDLAVLDDFDPNSLDFNSFDHGREQGARQEESHHYNPFETSREAAGERSAEEPSLNAFSDPFAPGREQREVRAEVSSDRNFVREGELREHDHNAYESGDLGLEAADFPLRSLTAEDETLLLGRKPSRETADNQNGFHELDFDLDLPNASFGSTEVPKLANEFDAPSNTLELEPSAGEPKFTDSVSKVELPSPVSEATSLTQSTPVVVASTVETPKPGQSVQPSGSAFNAAWEKRQLLTAGAVGAISALVVAVGSFTAAMMVPQPSRAAVRNTGGAMAVVALIASGGATLLLGRKTAKQIQRTTIDLKNQFEAMRAGNFNAKATIYPQDDFGFLASGFNEMTKVMSTTIRDTQRKAEEQERAKEDLQRQVIRLLDDVEGAARGDLTVQATVSADVLGAVADSFNLTIYNLREIVQQVKLAARQVSKGAVDSETFARALSSDALRQAEELAVTLNSVQVMTDAIQRIAESAREAEAVARSASATAKKGGEAVERTVAGILEIRQTVAHTTRKVKRLAESSQEISKIVALISQIASRTNLLALNASIEAARAGESGRGFAIVADEVRQLADRVAKALKEIEQIVRQIQSETGSVMTAMEEGTQQVIQGTHLAEQAKRSLEDIVQVSNRIDTLVRSINADTVEQTESSRAVATVMQSVELTAQETSQEAQRVSGSLHSLARVAGDLLNSVERFRVETTESR